VPVEEVHGLSPVARMGDGPGGELLPVGGTRSRA
jgi:hypothetical protein